MRLKTGTLVQIKGSKIVGTIVSREAYKNLHQPFLVRYYVEGKGFVTDVFDSRELYKLDK